MRGLFALSLLCTVASQALAYEDVAAERGLAYTGPTSGDPGVGDYDGDGDMDLLIPKHDAAPWPIMRNDGHRFTQVGQLPKADRHGCDSADLNGDGKDEVFCVHGGCEGAATCNKANELWFNLTSTPVNRAGAWRVTGGTKERGRDAEFFRIANTLHLAVANVKSPLGANASRNRLYKQSGGQFVSVPIPLSWAITVAVDDMTDDGRKELFFGDQSGVLSLRRQSDGRWSTMSGPWSRTWARDIEQTPYGLAVVGPNELTLFSRTRVEFRYPLGDGVDMALPFYNDIYIAQGDGAYRDILLHWDYRGFTAVENLPQATAGHGDSATKVGNECVFVANGKWTREQGPVQLICEGP